MNTFFPEQKYPKPLANVPEGGGPIMLIASLTMADKPLFKETPFGEYPTLEQLASGLINFHMAAHVSQLQNLCR
jgi:hypothetical protein